MVSSTTKMQQAFLSRLWKNLQAKAGTRKLCNIMLHLLCMYVLRCAFAIGLWNMLFSFCRDPDERRRNKRLLNPSSSIACLLPPLKTAKRVCKVTLVLLTPLVPESLAYMWVVIHLFIYSFTANWFVWRFGGWEKIPIRWGIQCTVSTLESSSISNCDVLFSQVAGRM